MDSKNNTLKHLTKEELKNILNECHESESLRNRLNDESLHNRGIKLAIKIMKKYPYISYNGITLETNYDMSSKNWFNCYTSPLAYELGANYDYSGTRESASVGHVWLILTHFTYALSLDKQ